MIVVNFAPANAAAIEVEVADGREIGVLARAAERIYPGSVDARRQAERDARYQALMLARKKRSRAGG